MLEVTLFKIGAQIVSKPSTYHYIVSLNSENNSSHNEDKQK